MDPEALGREYDKIARHWQEPFLQTNGLAQFEKPSVSQRIAVRP
jgi:hypothetical protein